jgi:Tol biopolymer transport system component
MGEVYRARDTRLKRDVAIKILPAEFSSNPDRLSRFQGEAEVLASLNHPNIAAIYDFEEVNGSRFLVLELVEGETLAERLVRGQLSVKDALGIAKSICEALEAAHEKGVVHRDLKPANVKITPDGKVKVLDFGLAKVYQAESANVDPSNSPTLTMGATSAGVILGTAAYMSPEQACAQKVDKRSDIWSFGVLLWEMLTGKSLFDGPTTSHILADVLRREVDFSELPTETPSAIRTLLRRCLNRDVKNRLRDIGEARIAIEEIGIEPEVKSVRPRPGRVVWIWAAVATVAALALGFVEYFRVPTEPLRIFKMSVLPPEKASLLGDIPAVSPDGQRLAFVAALNGNSGLWVRDLGSLESRLLPGTEGAALPFWSYDGRFLGFFANGKLKKTESAGGPVLTLCDAPDGRGGTWNQSDVILFVPAIISPIFRILAAGGTPTPVTTINEQEPGHRYPRFLPDGRHFLYTSYGQSREKDEVFVADLESGNRSPLIAAASNAVYSSGYLLFLRGLMLMAQPFDTDKLQMSGDAVPIVEQVGYLNIDIRGYFSSSQNGVLAYDSPRRSNVVSDTQLTWFDRSGKMSGTVGEPGGLAGAAISPNGNAVATSVLDPQSGLMDIWLLDLVRGTSSRFTLNSQNNFQPVWSPDNRQIVFYSTPGGMSTVYRRALDRAGQDEILDQSTSIRSATDWSRDGRYVIEQTQGAGDSQSGWDIWVRPMSSDGGEKKSFPYLQTNANETNAKISPDGQWLAYQSDESRRSEIYVEKFPEHGGKRQVSNNGGSIPVWSRDGKELFYIDADGKMTAVEVLGPKFDLGTHKSLFDVRTVANVFGQSNAPLRGTSYDVGKDGRFLIPVPVDRAGASEASPLTVVLNWQAQLKK